jgi:two-component system, OmpR family, phosphate regulon sensor histidine kinase PhoR
VVRGIALKVRGITLSIRWRISILFVGLLLLTIGGMGYFFFDSVRAGYQDSVRINLIEEARLVSSIVEPSIKAGRPNTDLDRLVKNIAAQLSVRVTIIASDGEVIGESDADEEIMVNHLGRPEVQEVLKGSPGGSQIRYSDTLHTRMLYVAVPVEDEGRIAAVTRLARTLSGIENDLNDIQKTMLISMGIAGVLAILFSLWVSGYTVSPLEQLVQAAQQLTAGNYDQQLLPESQGEIGRLNKVFNEMANQIKLQITALQNEQGKTNGVLDQLMDGVVIVDASGVVRLINPAAVRIFKLENKPAVGLSLLEVSESSKIWDMWRECLDSGEQQSLGLSTGTSGSYVQAIATSLGQTQPGSTLLLFQDLTRQRRLETVRQDFISNVSHELRTPLASLKALTETLQEGALDDPPAARRFLERMETEIDTLTQLVRELLELSRIESGQVPLNRRAISPGELAGPSVERMRLQAERAGIILELVCDPILPAVSADPERMEQVFVNLIHNAIKFTPPGGSIKVSAEREKQHVTFRVRDSGVGISEADQPRIFERFYKADRARTGGGTGLGLSIARHMVEAHGGRIWVESMPGIGSTFSFSLPVAKQR